MVYISVLYKPQNKILLLVYLCYYFKCNECKCDKFFVIKCVNVIY